jgi:molecular chaperone DnaK (HSP70)
MGNWERGIPVVEIPLQVLVHGEMVAEIFSRDQQPPASFSIWFTTSKDFQIDLEFELKSTLHDAQELLVYSVAGLSSKPCGAIKVEVLFSVDEDGRLQVQAAEHPGTRPLKVSRLR